MKLSQAMYGIVLTLGLQGGAYAGAVTWDFTGTSACDESLSTGGVSTDAVNCTTAGETLILNAFAQVKNPDGSFNPTFNNAKLTRNEINGLGVNKEVSDSSAQIDNQDNIDLILFDFDFFLEDLTIEFGSVSSSDHFSLWLGSGLDALYADAGNGIDSFTDLNFVTLESIAGFTKTTGQISLSNPFSLSGLSGIDQLIIAPAIGQTDDKFRIKQISVVPEPSSLFLFFAGLLLLTALNSRRKMVAQRFAPRLK
ncbi:PEP-CTERM sorting domain-containing protein [endosymbiont of Lamellibrachia barhami]|uniref:PEP-CTERM sorting domain-containing protein n=1 Tax=endosymbiont of Lamellibrachia barhami TaxID=205975 RepID=UPI0015AF2AF8|nr:PEP-CTERM sorting domain-containing protein [endosymbiont of Lamellibrachia barhami]